MNNPPRQSRLGPRNLRVVLEQRPLALAQFLAPIHAADLADWFPDLDDDEVWQSFEALDLETRAEVLQEAEKPLRERLLRMLDAAQLVELVQALPVDEAHDVLALADDYTVAQVLREVDDELENELRQLAAHPIETAGGEMTTEYLAVPLDARIGDAIKVVKGAEEGLAEAGVGVFVVDNEGRPVGFVSDHDLLTHGIHARVADVMERDLVTVLASVDREEAAKLVSKYSLLAIPVVDDAGHMLGILTAEDALEVLEEEASEDMTLLAGASAAHQTRLPLLRRVRTRLPLMAVTVLGGLVTAWILDRAFPDGDSGLGGADLLRYLPIVIGLAGNVGIQSSTILVRAFATGEVESEREISVLTTEVLAGTSIGLLCALISAGVAAQLEASGLFGLAVGLAIWIAVTWASLLGCVVPISCRRLGIDPAVVAGPFLITLSDISGSGIFVLVGQRVLDLGA